MLESLTFIQGYLSNQIQRVEINSSFSGYITFLITFLIRSQKTFQKLTLISVTHL